MIYVIKLCSEKITAFIEATEHVSITTEHKGVFIAEKNMLHNTLNLEQENEYVAIKFEVEDLSCHFLPLQNT